MNKEEFIERRGEAAYDKQLQRVRDWREVNPDKVKACNQERGRKGGKFYSALQTYYRSGLPYFRKLIRNKHARLYQDIKQATPNSQIHHEWEKGTTKYRGVALVETEAHRHGIIKVIKVLEGEITLFTEKQIREQGGEGVV